MRWRGDRASDGDGDGSDAKRRQSPRASSVTFAGPDDLRHRAARRHVGRTVATSCAVSGTQPLALAARDAIAMDGDADGQPGGDFVLHFDSGEPRDEDPRRALRWCLLVMTIGLGTAQRGTVLRRARRNEMRQLSREPERRRHAQCIGTTWAQTVLPARPIQFPGVEPWTGVVNRYIGVGGNLRAGYSYTDVPDGRRRIGVRGSRRRGSISVRRWFPIACCSTSTSASRRAAARPWKRMRASWTANPRWSVQARAQMYLPYGLAAGGRQRVHPAGDGDQLATHRIKASNSGGKPADWSAQLAVTNGTAERSREPRRASGEPARGVRRSSWRGRRRPQL